MKQNLYTAQHYTDPHIFDLEMRKVFSNTWHFCGLLEDLSEPNDYLTVQAGLNNIVVYRDQSGELKALHNLCRHRGMQLIEGEGQLKRTITCPYHDWTYDQAGKLKSMPKQKQEFTGVDKQCLSLKTAQAGIWRGMIWVHPDPLAMPLTEFFAPMTPYLAPYQVESLVEDKTHIIEEVIQANWKLVVENYIDHYHLAQLHSGTLTMYDHQNAEFGFAGEHFHFWQPLTEEYQKDITTHAPYPLLMDKTDSRLGAWVPMLFPCIGLAETESSWSVFQIIPMLVVVRSKVKHCSMMEYLKQATRSYHFWQNNTKAKSHKVDETHPLASGDFMQEDIYVCEQLQKSLYSPYFEFGPSANHGESPIRQFQQQLQKKLHP